jgi:hypothetical protein
MSMTLSSLRIGETLGRCLGEFFTAQALLWVHAVPAHSDALQTGDDDELSDCFTGNLLNDSNLSFSIAFHYGCSRGTTQAAQ